MASRKGKLKSSPGPWKANAAGYGDWNFDGGYRGVIEDANGELIYAGPAAFQAIRGATPVQAEANAFMMAAGPRLYAALKGVMEDSFNPEVVKEARAALESAIPPAKKAR